MRGLILGLSLFLGAACGDSGGDSDAANNGANGNNGGDNNGNNGEPIPMGPFESLEERPCPPDSVLSYNNLGGPLLLNWCAGCHSEALTEDARAGATLGVDFDTIEDIRNHADRIWARAGDQNMSMPPAGGPPAADRTLLGEWLACGAPE